MRVPNTWLVASLTVAFFAVNCGQGGSVEGSPVAVHDGSWNGDQASLAGQLVNENGCLVVLADLTAAGTRVVPAFADQNLEWDATRQILTVRGREYEVGQEVRIGGSGWGLNLPDGMDWVNPPASTCIYDGIWGVTPPQR